MNYFNYFTEIEQFYQARRDTFTLLSTLDWVLIENWKEQGVPLDLVLKGIDRAFHVAGTTSMVTGVSPTASPSIW